MKVRKPDVDISLLLIFQKSLKFNASSLIRILLDNYSRQFTLSGWTISFPYAILEPHHALYFSAFTEVMPF